MRSPEESRGVQRGSEVLYEESHVQEGHIEEGQPCRGGPAMSKRAIYVEEVGTRTQDPGPRTKDEDPRRRTRTRTEDKDPGRRTRMVRTMSTTGKVKSPQHGHNTVKQKTLYKEFRS